VGVPGAAHKERVALDWRRVSGTIRAALMDNGATHLESYSVREHLPKVIDRSAETFLTSGWRGDMQKLRMPSATSRPRAAGTRRRRRREASRRLRKARRGR